jgi:hypothetical protein
MTSPVVAQLLATSGRYPRPSMPFIMLTHHARQVRLQHLASSALETFDILLINNFSIGSGQVTSHKSHSSVRLRLYTSGFDTSRQSSLPHDMALFFQSGLLFLFFFLRTSTPETGAALETTWPCSLPLFDLQPPTTHLITTLLTQFFAEVRQRCPPRRPLCSALT